MHGQWLSAQGRLSCWDRKNFPRCILYYDRDSEELSQELYTLCTECSRQPFHDLQCDHAQPNLQFCCCCGGGERGDYVYWLHECCHQKTRDPILLSLWRVRPEQ